MKADAIFAQSPVRNSRSRISMANEGNDTPPLDDGEDQNNIGDGDDKSVESVSLPDNVGTGLVVPGKLDVVFALKDDWSERMIRG